MAQHDSLTLAEKFRQYLLGSQGSKLDAICTTLESLARDHFNGQLPYSERIKLQAAQDEPDFYGAGIYGAADVKRVKGGLKKIYMHVRDGERHTLADISAATGVPEASVSAGLRSLRRDKYGAHTIVRYHVGNGLHTYRFIANMHTVADLEAQLKVEPLNQPVKIPVEREGEEPTEQNVDVKCFQCGKPFDIVADGQNICFQCLPF